MMNDLDVIGSTIGHYRIKDRLGTGGMGTVYHAFDLRLQRQVAVKVLNAQDSGTGHDDLLREARAASGLNHVHICTVYEVAEYDGRAILVMEYIEGRTLAELIGPTGLAAANVVRYGAQIAAALAHAHSRGIVHRDLKPANVIVTPEGIVKVLDFGIAHRAVAADVDEATGAVTRPVAAEQVSGTLPYMAPEMLQGRPADARSDVWALGVLLYEMMSGRRPYSASTSPELVAAILREEPSSLPAPAPAGLSAVVQRCLLREPQRRYTQGSEVYAALEALLPTMGDPQPAVRRPPVDRRWRAVFAVTAGVAVLVAVGLTLAGTGVFRTGAADTPTIRSLAVLPLDNLSVDTSQDYFAEGMTEALIANLARLGTLRVISRTSVMRYKDSPKPLPEIARELGVDAVVEGSVQRVNNRVRITAQLIDARTDSHLWARDYDSDVADTLQLQADVAGAIAREIGVQVGGRASSRPADRPVSPAAYDAYLRGRYHLARLNEEHLRRSIAEFERAIAIDPGYAAAYAGLANAWTERSVWGTVSFPDAEAPQRAAAERALALDDSLAEAHAAVGHLRYNRDWRWVDAERHFRRALELDPASVDARHYYALSLMALGRHDEAIAHMQRALDADPLSTLLHSSYGRILYRARRYPDAIRELERAIELDSSNFGAYGRLADVYEAQGDYDRAIALNQQSNALRGDAMAGRYSTALARLYALAGRRQEARAIERSLLSRPDGTGRGVGLAPLYAALGDRDAAFHSLNQAIDERQLVVFIKTEPKLDVLHDDPRWAATLRRINLTP